jgi:enterochelin esterase-like enzyme
MPSFPARSAFLTLFFASEVTTVRRALVLTFGTWAVLTLAWSGASRADEGSHELAAAPKGFDVRRAGVERGKVEAVTYDSKTIGGKGRMVVYTPPGYSRDDKYPVLYLLHGAGDDETGWQTRGAADAILDNLYADKKAVPMIVVMPNGWARAGGGRGNFGPGRGGFRPGTVLARAMMKRADPDGHGKVTLDEAVAAVKQLFQELDKDNKGTLDERQIAEGIDRVFAQAAGGGRGGARGPGGGRGPAVASPFENDLLKDIIPFIEAHYAVQANRQHRAIMGLSMGGSQALTIGLTHPDVFGSVGGFSSALFGNRPDLLTGPAGSGKRPRLLWLSCGDADGLLNASKAFHAGLEARHVPHVWHVDAGAHEWPVWKNDLYLVAQLLFRDR